jgi:putative CocE/NonD family hydrolase
MPDGCRIAVDVYVPEPIAAGAPPSDDRFPTVAIFTPYYRRFKVRAGGTTDGGVNIALYRDFFVPRGYALVIVDVRGTGASFGTRDSFRSPNERRDSHAIADWIVAQPWSDGAIGATGISYLGAAADFLASTGHPAVKAIAPLFAVWDTYADNYFPGGVQVKSLTRLYDEMMIGLDHDRRDVLEPFAYFNNPDFEGPQPVDGDEDAMLLAQAIREHLGNFRQTDFMAEFRFREEPLPYDPSFSSASFSPYSYSRGVRDDVAVLSVSGWYDGAGYANGAISRFLTLDKNPRFLLLGPWDHGARSDISPWRRAAAADFPVLGEVLRLFDTYLKGEDTGLREEQPVHYFCVHAQEWRGCASWPPAKSEHGLRFGPAGTLTEAVAVPSSDVHKVDFGIGTGHHTRYERIAGIAITDYYTDWQGRSTRMLSYTSAPIGAALDMAGHALVDLALSSSEPDASLFLYLSEIEADGTERYVTEGLLRLLHRKLSPAPSTYRATWPFRSFARADAAPMPVDAAETVRVPLLPIAWRFAKGSRIRLSIAGADADHCSQVPHGRPPTLRVQFGGEGGSRLILPLA